MKKLKLLQIRGRFTSTEPTYLPEQLKWLCWICYPFKSLTITKDMSKLVGLEMPFGRITQLQIEKKVIPTNLKFMDLRRSHFIARFPDFSAVPNLERLNLSFCKILVEIHPSVLLHEKIIHLDLSFCNALEFLPSCIKMKSLQTLHLVSCTSLKSFPKVSGEMGKLLVLNISGCDRITTLPLSIRLFTRLSVLSLGRSCPLGRYYERTIPGPRIQGCKLLSSLRIMDLKSNNLFQDDIPTDLHNMWPFLEELDLSENMFTGLPASISLLSHLKYLNLSGCVRLKELPELPSLIQVLKADRCKSLQKIEDFSNNYKWLFKISLYYCPKLLIYQESYLASFLILSLVQKCAAVNHRLSIALPGSKIPDWFSNQRLGNTITLKLPQNRITKMIGLALCCCFSPLTPLRIKFDVSSEEHLIGRPAARAAKSADAVWTGYLSIDILGNLCHCFESEDLIISFEDDVVECGVCVVYEEDTKPVTGIDSWIPDYDELRRIDHESTSSDDWHHGRWSKPTFYFGGSKIGDHKTIEIWG